MVVAAAADATMTQAATPAATPAVTTAAPVAATTPASAPVTAVPAAGSNPPPAATAAPTGTLLSNAAATEAPKAEAKPAETATPAPATELKLEIPKDSGLTQADVDEIAALAKSNGFNQKQAEALVANQVSSRNAQLVAAQKQFQESAAQFKNDPEYGGAKLAESQISMRRVMTSPLMPADLKAVLSDPKLPYGDFAPLAKFITNIGRLLGEDGMIPTNRQPAKADVPIHHVFYPPAKSG